MLVALKKTVIFEAIEKEKTTESGIILKNAVEPQTEARIISVGPQADCGVKVGDRVLVDWNRVGKINHDENTYYVTDQSNLIGIFGE